MFGGSDAHVLFPNGKEEIALNHPRIKTNDGVVAAQLHTDVGRTKKKGKTKSEFFVNHEYVSLV